MNDAADAGAIKVLLVDDHPIVREGYRRLLDRLGGFQVVGEAGEAAAAYDVFRRIEPDVVVMDISMPGASGLEAVRHIRQWDPNARILVSSMHCTAALALKAFEAGASGYVAKSAEPSEFAEAIRVVARGGRALSADISRAIAEETIAGGRSILECLSPREAEILRQIALGSTSQEIAATLNVSIKTVQNHHYRIKDKIGARSDAHLVWLAVGAGLIEGGSDRLRPD
jgi:two-component system, NarL family, invasion response regulator UvrY